MERVRSRFQGVSNVVRFNWHFYLSSAIAALFFFVAGSYFESTVCYALGTLILVQVAITLGVTYYVYDVSNLYSLNLLDGISIDAAGNFVSLNAGFDETSDILRHRNPKADVKVFDFYDAGLHTETSIKRARESQSVDGESTKINSSRIPLDDNWANAVFLFFSAHEIRDDAERIRFFAELRRICNDTGRIVVTEHIRDAANLIAYNVGAFHFLSRSVWEKTFESSQLTLADEIKTTPFVTTFVLKKNGDPS